MSEFLVFGFERVNEKGVGVIFADIGMVDAGLLVGDEVNSLLILFAVDWCW